MYEILEDAGIFAWPLGLCSVLAVFIVVERLVVLRKGRVVPSRLRDEFAMGSVPANVDGNSIAEKLVRHFRDTRPGAEQLKAFARLQISRMERGLFLLEVVVSAAPLIGLLGTVTGLVRVFHDISPDTGVPDAAAFIEGVPLALTTTMLGLFIAIPALAFHSLIARRVEAHAADLEVVVETLIAEESLNQKSV